MAMLTIDGLLCGIDEMDVNQRILIQSELLSILYIQVSPMRIVVPSKSHSIVLQCA